MGCRKYQSVEAATVATAVVATPPSLPQAHFDRWAQICAKGRHVHDITFSNIFFWKGKQM